MSALESGPETLYCVQITSPTQLIKPNYSIFIINAFFV